MSDRSSHTFFVTCAPGLEALLHEELRGLKLSKLERQVGGARFEGRLEDAWKVNLRSRIAIRVLLRLARFQAPNAEALHAGALEVAWERFLSPDGTFRIDAQTSESALDHSHFVEQRVKDAVADSFRARHGSRPSVDLETPDLSIHVHLSRDRCTLSADTSGDSLHKRGWRKYQGRAPLAETLAAALVLDSGWDRRSPLLDPFCGSGTILVEAALLAADVPPGSFRRSFGFERWLGHDAAAWRAMVDRARAQSRFPPKLVLRGTDADAAAIEGARANAAAAGLADRIELEVANLSAFEPRRGWNAWIVTNPPYGERIGRGTDLGPLYAELGSILKDRCAGYHVSVLSGNPALPAAIGIPTERRRAVRNGPLECEFLGFSIPASSNSKSRQR
jgi:putative N6-adenine-specific DNA methylase